MIATPAWGAATLATSIIPAISVRAAIGASLAVSNVLPVMPAINVKTARAVRDLATPAIGATRHVMTAFPVKVHARAVKSVRFAIRESLRRNENGLCELFYLPDLRDESGGSTRSDRLLATKRRASAKGGTSTWRSKASASHNDHALHQPCL